jgi:hypothetical protein
MAPTGLYPKFGWTYAALRQTVQASGDAAFALAGPVAPDLNSPVRVWWTGLRQFLQFALPKSTRRILPKDFRAAARRSWLPEPPNLPWPDLIVSDLAPTEPRDVSLASLFQPVLPAGWTWWTVGSRPGVPFVFSHRIFTQTVLVDPKVVAAPALVSSGVPVQHRTPRPISLPENSFVQEALAPIRPWGSAAEKPATLPDPKNPQPFHREEEGHISIGQPCDNACSRSATRPNQEPSPSLCSAHHRGASGSASAKSLTSMHPAPTSGTSAQLCSPRPAAFRSRPFPASFRASLCPVTRSSPPPARGPKALPSLYRSAPNRKKVCPRPINCRTISPPATPSSSPSPSASTAAVAMKPCHSSPSSPSSKTPSTTARSAPRPSPVNSTISTSLPTARAAIGILRSMSFIAPPTRHRPPSRSSSFAGSSHGGTAHPARPTPRHGQRPLDD